MKNILINQTEFAKKSCGEMEGNAKNVKIFITPSENIIWTFFFFFNLTSINFNINIGLG